MGAASRWSGIPKPSTMRCAEGPSAMTDARTASGMAVDACSGSSACPMYQARSRSTQASPYTTPHAVTTFARAGEGGASLLGTRAPSDATTASITSRSAYASAAACTVSLCRFIHSSKNPAFAPAMALPSASNARASRTASSARSACSASSPVPEVITASGGTGAACAEPQRSLYLGHDAMPSSSLATFCISTLLSPSAVMPACAKPSSVPKRFTLR
mmetsp:Transcript_19803/g.50265  ORF Transcript_19803/g.50265 Transcript_19803/m.50265 type:complete len:217 (+) Transcript_19803:510-1160(+)